MPIELDGQTATQVPHWMQRSGVDDPGLELPEPRLARRLLDAVHLVADAGSPSSARRRLGPGDRVPVPLGQRRAVVVGHPAGPVVEGLVLSPLRLVAADDPQQRVGHVVDRPGVLDPVDERRRRSRAIRPCPMSTASARCSPTWATSPRKPMSAIWGWAQLAEHPEKCIRTTPASSRAGPAPGGRGTHRLAGQLLVEEAGPLDRALLRLDDGVPAELGPGAGHHTPGEGPREGRVLGEQVLGEQVVDPIARARR